MLDDKRQDFVCGFPYQLSIQEGLIFEEDVTDQMAESDFSEVKWSMEMDSLWWGDSDGTFFDFNSISKNRKIKYPMLPERLANKLGNSSKVTIPLKQVGEKRILSADIALMSSSKKTDNDASAIWINQLIPTKAGRYSNNIIYGDANEGLRTADEALLIRRLYEEFSCDYIVIDASGVGLGVADALMGEIVDPETGEVYPPLSCCNDPTMAERCTDKGADKVIWSIKASAALNSECALLLREGFRSGKIRLLMNEYDADTLMAEIKGWGNLTPAEKIMMEAPYIHTTLLINELVKLKHEETAGRIKLQERRKMRKDRYSSLAYNYYVATQLESKLAKRNTEEMNVSDIFTIRAPKTLKRRRKVRNWEEKRAAV